MRSGRRHKHPIAMQIGRVAGRPAWRAERIRMIAIAHQGNFQIALWHCEETN